MGWDIQDYEAKKKCLETEEEDEDDDGEGDEEGGRQTTRKTPPDGGWGWMVVLGAFFCNLIVDGVCFSFSVIRDEYKIVFNASTPQSGWIGSSLAACYLLSAPFASALVTWYGCRRVTIAGSIIAAFGFGLSTQATSIDFLIVTYGCIGGIGFGMMYLPSIVCVGYWFEEKKGLATGIALCGSGVGLFLFPPLAQELLREYQWTGHNLLLAGIVLHGIICGALFRPLEGGTRRKKRRRVKKRVEIEHGIIMKALIEEKKRQRTISNGSLDNCIITRDNRLIKLGSALFDAKRDNSVLAKFKRQLGFSSTSLASKNSLQGIPSFVIDAVQDLTNARATGSPRAGMRFHQVGNGSSIPTLASSVAPPATGATALANGATPCRFPKTRSCDALSGQDQGAMAVGAECQPLNLLGGGNSMGISRSASDLPSTPIPPPLMNDASVISIQVIPNDSCPQGSVISVRCRSNTSMASSDAANQLGVSETTTYVTTSLMTVPQVDASEEDMERALDHESSILWKFGQICCLMINVKLLTNPVLLLLLVSSFCTMLAFYVPYFFLPNMGLEINMAPAEAYFLISIIGVMSMIGRLMTGWMADRPWVDSVIMNIGALICSGIVMALIPFCNNEMLLAVAAALIGLFFAVFLALRSVLLMDLLGTDLLNRSFGILLLFQGLASLIGPEVAAEIVRTNDSIQPTFVFAGILTIFSGLLLVPVKILMCRKNNKKREGDKKMSKKLKP